MRARRRRGAARPSTSPTSPMAEHPPSSRRTRSAPAISTPASGASRRSRSSSPSARSCRGRRRTSGAIATQSYANPRYGPDGLELLRDGLAADEVVERLTAADDGRDQRQLGIVDAAGRGATFTGAACHDWAGGRAGDGYAAQGNILVSARHGRRARGHVRRLRRHGRSPSGCSTASPPHRPRAATAAASSPRRCSSSSATAATPALSDTLVDLRVDDHERPVEELRRLFGLHQTLFGKTPRERLARRRRRAPGRDRRAARSARPGDARGLGGGREPRGAGRRQRPDRSGRPRGAAETQMTRAVPGDAARRGRRLRRRGPPALAHDPRACSGSSRSAINAWRATEAGQADRRRARRARTGSRRARGALPRALRAGDVHARRRDGRGAPAGSLVFVKDPAARSASAVADEAGHDGPRGRWASPASPSRVSPWERSAEALRFWTTGDWDERDRGRSRRSSPSDPDNANVLYNLACAESRARQRSRRRSLISRRAVELEPRFAELAHGDTDFDAIRGRRRASPWPSEPESPGSRREPARARRGTPGRDRAPDARREDGRDARAGECGDEQLEADRKRERLVGVLAPERHELLGPRATCDDVAVRDRAHRHVRDERLSLARGDRDRERVRPRQRRAARGWREPARRGRRQQRHEPPGREAADPVAERAGRKARRRHDEARTRDAFGEDVVEDRRERQVAEGAGTLPAVDPVPARWS